MTFHREKETKPKHERMVALVEAKDSVEGAALWALITGTHVSAEKVSKIIAEEMSNYTDDKGLQTLSSRHILRIRKGITS